MIRVCREDGLPFERPRDQIAVKQDDLTLVRVAGLAVAPMLCVHILQKLDSVGRWCAAVESDAEVWVRVDVA